VSAPLSHYSLRVAAVTLFFCTFGARVLPSLCLLYSFSLGHVSGKLSGFLCRFVLPYLSLFNSFLRGLLPGESVRPLCCSLPSAGTPDLLNFRRSNPNFLKGVFPFAPRCLCGPSPENAQQRTTPIPKRTCVTFSLHAR